MWEAHHLPCGPKTRNRNHNQPTGNLPIPITTVILASASGFHRPGTTKRVTQPEPTNPTKEQTMSDTTTYDTVYSRDEVLESYPEQYRDRAAELIPNPAYAAVYVNRLIHGHTDFDYFDAAHDTAKYNTLFEGPTGSGKTFATQAYAAHLGVPWIRVEFHRQAAVEKAFGKNDFRDGQTIYTPGDIVVGLHGLSVILLDEISNINPGSFAALHGLLDNGGSVYVPQTGTTVKRAKGVRMFGAYNPKYAGNMELSEAGRNRFAYPMYWGYDADVEDALIGETCPTLLRIVRSLRAEPKVYSDISTNSMQEYIDSARALSVEAANYLFTNRFKEGERMAVSTTLEAEAWNIGKELAL